jgi:hypothetical protein
MITYNRYCKSWAVAKWLIAAPFMLAGFVIGALFCGLYVGFGIGRDI